MVPGLRRASRMLATWIRADRHVPAMAILRRMLEEHHNFRLDHRCWRKPGNSTTPMWSSPPTTAATSTNPTQIISVSTDHLGRQLDLRGIRVPFVSGPASDIGAPPCPSFSGLRRPADLAGSQCGSLPASMVEICDVFESGDAGSVKAECGWIDFSLHLPFRSAVIAIRIGDYKLLFGI